MSIIQGGGLCEQTKKSHCLIPKPNNDSIIKNVLTNGNILAPLL